MFWSSCIAGLVINLNGRGGQVELLNVQLNTKTFCITPVTALPSTTAATAGDEEDRDEDQRSYQEDGEDHQGEHIAILLLLCLKWDLLR